MRSRTCFVSCLRTMASAVGRNQENPTEAADLVWNKSDSLHWWEVYDNYFWAWAWMWLVHSKHSHMPQFRRLCTLIFICVLFASFFAWNVLICFSLNFAEVSVCLLFYFRTFCWTLCLTHNKTIHITYITLQYHKHFRISSYYSVTYIGAYVFYAFMSEEWGSLYPPAGLLWLSG